MITCPDGLSLRAKVFAPSDGGAAKVERQAHGASLASRECNRDRIRIEGVPHVRMLGPVERRDREHRHASVGGAVEDEWLPDTAWAMAYQLARGTSRGAEQASKIERMLPYFENQAHRMDDVTPRRDGLPIGCGTSKRRARASSIFG